MRLPFKREPKWHENRWRLLAIYNAECSRGIVHTPEWDARMAEDQKRFNEWQACESNQG